MKKNSLTGIIFFLLISSNLGADAVFSGNPVSVNPDSGFNAVRNPALMQVQKGDSFSVGLDQSFIFSTDYEGDLSFSDSNITEEKLGFEYSEDFKGSLTLSYVDREKSSSFGLGLRAGDDSNLVFKKSDITIEALYTGLPYEVSADEEEVVVSFTPVISWAFRLEGNTFLGLTFESTVYKSSLESDSVSRVNGAVTEETTREEEFQRYTGGFSLGYYMAGEKFDVGLVINTGRYGYEKHELDYENHTSAAKVSDDVPWYFYKDRSAEIVAGVVLRPSYRMKIMLEAGTSVPFVSRRREIDDESLTEVRSENRSDYGMLAKAGIDYALSSRMKGGIGLAFYRFSSRSYFEDIHVGKSTILGYEVQGGLDFRMGGGLNLLLGGGFMYAESDLRTYNSPNIMNIRAETLNCTVSTGVAMYY